MTETETKLDPAAARADAEKMTKAQLVRELDALAVDANVEERKSELVEKLVDAWLAGSRDAAGIDEVEAEVVAETDEPVEPEPAAAEVAAAESRALALRDEPVVHAPALLPTTAEFDSMMAIATRVANTTMVPKAYRGKPDDVVAAILTGRELGLGPMQSLRDIHVVDGKPSLSSNLLLARLRAGGIRILDSTSTAERAWIRAERRDTGEVAEVEWTIEEARAATFSSWEGPQGNRSKVQRSLAEKDNWVSYPTDMLWARAVGRLARRLGSDLIGAAMPYSSEEIQDWDDYEGGGSTMNAAPVERPRADVGRGGDGSPAWNPPADWKELSSRIAGVLTADDAAAWMEELATKGYGRQKLSEVVADPELPDDRKRDLWRRLCALLRKLDETPGEIPFRPDVREFVSSAISEAFDGKLALVGPLYALGPDETARGLPPKPGSTPAETPAGGSEDASGAETSAEAVVDGSAAPVVDADGNEIEF